MKTKLYELPGLNGEYVEFDYGEYNYSQITTLLTSIQSISLPPFTRIILYCRDNFFGSNHIISNAGRKQLKVPCFSNVFPQPVLSIKIDCSCTRNATNNVKYEIIKYDFVRSNITIGYTFYKVIPLPLDDPLDPPSPYNPAAILIPDFGTERQTYECLQEKFAKKRVSSLVLDIRGVGDSHSSTSVQYAEIIQDYRFIMAKLGLYSKKPIVLGHGYGGAIAQLWALTYKLELSKLILIGSAPYATYSTYNTAEPQIQQWVSNLLTQQQIGDYIAALTYNVPSDECSNDKLSMDLTQSIQDANSITLKLFITQNPDNLLLALAPKYIIVSTFVIHGLHDAYIDIAGSDDLIGMIPGSVCRKFATGHSPHLTASSRLFDAVMKFLSPTGLTYF